MRLIYRQAVFAFKHSPLMLCSKLCILHSNTFLSCYVVMFKAVCITFKHSPFMLCSKLFILHSNTLHSCYVAMFKAVYFTFKHSPLMLCCYVQSCLFYILTLSTHVMLLCSKLFILHSDTLHSCYVVMFKAVYFTF